jgi:hypothetical protein
MYKITCQKILILFSDVPSKTMFIVQCRVRIVVVFTAIINQSIEPLLFINLVIRVGVCSIQLDQLLAADR